MRLLCYCHHYYYYFHHALSGGRGRNRRELLSALRFVRVDHRPLQPCSRRPDLWVSIPAIRFDSTSSSTVDQNATDATLDTEGDQVSTAAARVQAVQMNWEESIHSEATLVVLDVVYVPTYDVYAMSSLGRRVWVSKERGRRRRYRCRAFCTRQQRGRCRSVRRSEVTS